MKKAFLKIVLTVAAVIACLSLPASAATVISLNFGTGSGTWTDVSGTWSGTFTISQVQILDPSDPNNGGNTYSDTVNLSPAVDDFSISFNSSTPTLTVATGTPQAPFANMTSGTSVYSGTSGLTETCTSCSSSVLSLTITAGTATGVNASFLADVGLPAGTTFTIGGGITGSGSSGSGAVASDTLTLVTSNSVTPTPEPSSMFLLAAGLAAAVAMARRRRPGAVKSTRACA
jgi:hypothetical protein